MTSPLRLTSLPDENIMDLHNLVFAGVNLIVTQKCKKKLRKEENAGN